MLGVVPLTNSFTSYHIAPMFWCTKWYAPLVKETKGQRPTHLLLLLYSVWAIITHYSFKRYTNMRPPTLPILHLGG